MAQDQELEKEEKNFFEFFFDIPNIEEIKDKDLRDELWYFANEQGYNIEVRDSSQIQVVATWIENDLIEILRKYGFYIHSMHSATHQDIAMEDDFEEDNKDQTPVLKAIFKKSYKGMRRTTQLTDWIKETIEFYLFKMNSRYQLKDIELILDEEYMRIIDGHMHKMSNRTAAEIKHHNDKCFNWGSDLDTYALAHICGTTDDTHHRLWINIEFHRDLAQLQHTIVHELIHLNFRKVKHGPKFEKLIDKYIHVGTTKK